MLNRLNMVRLSKAKVKYFGSPEYYPCCLIEADTEIIFRKSQNHPVAS
jgi:hypothetical protein